MQVRVVETGADKLLAVIDHRRDGRRGGNHVIGRANCNDVITRDAFLYLYIHLLRLIFIEPTDYYYSIYFFFSSSTSLCASFLFFLRQFCTDLVFYFFQT